MTQDASLCDACRSPGNCCRGFALNLTFPRENWKQDADKDMAERGLPFVAMSPVIESISDAGGAVLVRFACNKLGKDGRCSDYENRPILCQTYAPASDPICAEHVRKLRGIPILVERAN